MFPTTEAVGQTLNLNSIPSRVVWKLVKLLLTRQRFLSQIAGDGLASRGSRVIFGTCGLRRAHGGNPMNMKNTLVLAVAIAGALVIQPASAGAIHSFVITENSSTSLTVTY